MTPGEPHPDTNDPPLAARPVEAVSHDDGGATGPRILAVATQGAGGDDEARLRALLVGARAEFFPFDRRTKRRSFFGLWKAIRAGRPDLLMVEGTGIAGGVAAMLGRRLHGIPYVISSGDSVGPFMAARSPLLGPPFAVYERLLCRWSAGFIGWTPYLAGRALTFGAPRAMTAPGWAPSKLAPGEWARRRAEVRRRLGVDEDAVIVGIVGSLTWNRRYAYCYGLELVRAMARVSRANVVALIVGDGDGRANLERIAAESARGNVILTGRVPRDEVPHYLAAMDLASLPQSRDRVGSFRYTTKISEYMAAGLPIVTGQIPLAYDLDSGWIWRLPGWSPWSPEYIDALAMLLDRLTPAELAARRDAVPIDHPDFQAERQIIRVSEFLNDIVASQK